MAKKVPGRESVSSAALFFAVCRNLCRSSSKLWRYPADSECKFISFRRQRWDLDLFWRAVYVKAAWHLLVIFAFSFTTLAVGNPVIPTQTSDHSSCEKVLQQAPLLPAISTVVSEATTLNDTPNEVEVEIYVRMTSALQESWGFAIESLNAMIASPLPVLPQFNWNDLTINEHKARWDELLADPSLRWNLVQELLRALKDKLTDQQNLKDESRLQKELLSTPIPLGVFNAHLIQEVLRYDGAKMFVLTLRGPKENGHLMIPIENKNYSQDQFQGLFAEPFFYEGTLPPDHYIFYLPDGSFIATNLRPTDLPADASSSRKLSLTALANYRTQKDYGDVEVAGMAEIDGNLHLAAYHFHSLVSGIARKFSQPTKYRLIEEFAFLPLKSDKQPLIFASKSDLKKSQFPIDGRVRFEQINVDGKRFGIWSVGPKFWIFDYQSRRPISLKKPQSKSVVRIFSTFKDHQSTSGLRIVQTKDRAFALSLGSNGLTIYDFGKLTSAESEADLRLTSWIFEINSGFSFALEDSKIYIAFDGFIRQADLADPTLPQKTFNELDILLKSTQIGISNKTAISFWFMGKQFLALGDRGNRLTLFDLKNKGSSPSVSIEIPLTSEKLIVVTSEKAAALLTILNSNFGNHKIHITQMIGPDNATFEHYRNLLFKPEAQ